MALKNGSCVESSKVPLLNPFVEKYCSTLVLPYLIRDLEAASAVEEVDVVAKAKGKKKTFGGSSVPLQK
ncbi:hypothetical protein L2E82_04656 [Cichorium intybus]|uniref:Uncharacterized protein n=1 Tax=Cichorium intybus TaxID=13427 RepID=A0ACB9H7D3_CICIN|nr:hypothetical protein L2E82_04656 [Cichorium intybus]